MLVLIVGFGLLASWSGRPSDKTFEIVKNLDIFAALYKEVNAYYVDDINPAKFMNTGIVAMLSSLDPYTNYIPEDDIEDYRTATTGEYGGIGAIVEKKDGISTVLMSYEGFPAHKAGIKAGDQIIKINGIDIKDKPSDAISKLLKGQSNSKITLTARRYGVEKPFELSMNREKITVKNVPYFGMITDDIGYLKLVNFTTEAGYEVSKAVKGLKAKGAEKIILDLRDNPGGLLEEAINVSNVFIGRGMKVVTTTGKLNNWTKTYSTLDQPVDIRMPLAILINNSSASAAEIVSGVVQDYDRGVLVGRRSFGKGLVQQTRPLPYNAQLKVTTAKYYTPSGRCIQAIDYSRGGKIADSLTAGFKTRAGRLVYGGGGVAPDIEIPEPDFPPVIYGLIKGDFFFHYATEYYYNHSGIPQAKDFSLDGEGYKSFQDWLKEKDLKYATQVERDIDKLVASAKKEQYYQNIEGIVAHLREEASHNKDLDLEKHKARIKSILEQEIAGRYYNQSGIIESSFDGDLDIIGAVEVLNDTDRYQSILEGG